MVVLVLNAARRQASRVELEPLAVEVLGADDDSLGALHLEEDSREAETALVAPLPALARADLGVDEDLSLPGVAVARAVHHEQPLRDAHLRRRQADSRRRVHRL